MSTSPSLALAFVVLCLSACAQSAIRDDVERDGGAGPLPEDDAGSDPADAEPPLEAGAAPDSDDTAPPSPAPGAIRPGSLDAGMTTSDAAVSAMDAALPASPPSAAAPDASAPSPATIATAPAPAPAPASTQSAPQSPAPSPIVCPEAHTLCGDQCIDTRSSDAHCSRCGEPCGAGESCRNSRCERPAPQVTSTGASGSCSMRTFEAHSYLFCSEPRSWSEARKACHEAKMELALVGSQAESEHVRLAGDAWIGASDLQTEGTWLAPVPLDAQRTDGVPQVLVSWAEGEPSNTRRCTSGAAPQTCPPTQLVDEDCAMIRADGRWNDSECTSLRGFVCESL